MNAQEMFNKLGFVKMRDDNYFINYLMGSYQNYTHIEVQFNKTHKTYEVYQYNPQIINHNEFRKNGVEIESDNLNYIIGIELHQAITQQMKELGWL